MLACNKPLSKVGNINVECLNNAPVFDKCA